MELQKIMDNQLKNSNDYWNKKAFFYLIHFQNTDYYKFGITTNFTKRKNNIKTQWEECGADCCVIEEIAIIPVKNMAKAIILESQIRFKIFRKCLIFGNDYFQLNNENELEKIVDLMRK